MKKCVAIIMFLFVMGLIYSACTDQERTETNQVEKVDLVNESTDVKSEMTYQKFCASCHGEQMLAFADRKWKHGNSKEELMVSIAQGYPDAGMPAFSETLEKEALENLSKYIISGINEVEKYGFEEEQLTSNIFESEALTFELDTIFSGIEVPWSMAFLPDGDMLISERGGTLSRINESGKKVEINGVPKVMSRSQGGLLEVELHPLFEENQWLYLSYSGISPNDEKYTTVVDRYTLKNNRLTEKEEILVVRPYSKNVHHYGGKIAFDDQGYLFVSAGDRGERDTKPQSLSKSAGKIHRFLADGGIPEDNPFVDEPNAIKSIYSYGHRNPQGLAFNPMTKEIWEHEHGPRGGDEINIIQKGVNYGWPVISYGINYNGTIFTNKLEEEGMAQPLHYWVPSIAPSGMAFVTGNKYGDWEGDLLVGSLRFKYLTRCILENKKVVREEMLMKNIGRLRDVKMGPDGFIYIAVEKPGFIFRLMPKENLF